MMNLYFRISKWIGNKLSSSVYVLFSYYYFLIIIFYTCKEYYARCTSVETSICNLKCMTMVYVLNSLQIDYGWFYVTLDYLLYDCILIERLRDICIIRNFLQWEMHIVCKHRLCQDLCLSIARAIASSRLIFTYLKSSYPNQSYHVLYCQND